MRVNRVERREHERRSGQDRSLTEKIQKWRQQIEEKKRNVKK